MLDVIETFKQQIEQSKSVDEVRNILDNYYSSVVWSLEKAEYDSYNEEQKKLLSTIVFERFGNVK